MCNVFVATTRQAYYEGTTVAIGLPLCEDVSYCVGGFQSRYDPLQFRQSVECRQSLVISDCSVTRPTRILQM